MESNAMKELRRIRDENSKQHLVSSTEERLKEQAEAVDWLLVATQKNTEHQAS